MTTTTVTTTAATPTTATPTTAAPTTLADRAPTLLSLLAGYVGHRTVAMGLRTGLVAALADRPEGATPGELADALGFDDLYVGVWCRSAVAAGVCEREDDRYRLGEHMATLLLDTASPAHVGGVFTVMTQPEMFTRFEEVLPTGERLWWDGTPHDWINAVAGTGRPFYTRLVPGGLAQVPGLAARLADGGLIVDTACGTGTGVLRLAEHHPTCTVHGIDGDAYSISVARERAAGHPSGGRISFTHSPLEDMTIPGRAALVTNNISMHECRDIDEVTSRVRQALRPGGWFVISDFPFPDDDEGLRSVPGRIMTGVQYFEAQIGDQLVSPSTYRALLGQHGFSEVACQELSPVHVLTHGRLAA